MLHIGSIATCGDSRKVLAASRTSEGSVSWLCSDVEYLNSRDATIMGSRNGHAPIYMWYTLTRKGYEGMRKDVERCLRNAHLLKARLAHVLQWQCCGAACSKLSVVGASPGCHCPGGVSMFLCPG